MLFGDAQSLLLGRSIPVFHDSPIIHLIVDRDENRFDAHQILLFDAAPWFRTAMKPCWNESTGMRILMPEDDADVVHQFITWLYHRKFDFSKEDLKSPMFDMTICRLYVFADKFSAANLCRDTIRLLLAMLQWHSWKPTIDLLQYVEQNTLDHCGLSQLIIDWFAWHKEPTWFDSDEATALLEDAPHLAARLLRGLAQRLSKIPLKYAEKVAGGPLYYDVDKYIVVAAHQKGHESHQ
ncbi:uncharacterized protein HMPREF1541_10924 [Cyphellophora europaea CBS 101466]|uniref:BTB domain-containing protein n=1 Tax=Cyphellophora europaea (strain CBS 101466) TaxID=1220924 RepID=W2S808_CYPE1|nr:uncharacterized protein HMPREF1541_10924 [Cyphellophora europaea CBS 101466]ETN44059.1 hypothetical protein HMPREF1541_10924 [Cyphellophora europaea CBS 101466]